MATPCRVAIQKKIRRKNAGILRVACEMLHLCCVCLLRVEEKERKKERKRKKNERKEKWPRLKLTGSGNRWPEPDSLKQKPDNIQIIFNSPLCGRILDFLEILSP